MAQIEPLEILFEKRILREAIIRDTPVWCNRRIEHIQWNIFCVYAEVGRNKRRYRNVLAGSPKPGIVPRVFRRIQLIRHIIEALGNLNSRLLDEVIPGIGIEFIFYVVFYKRGIPTHYGGRELPRFVRRIVNELPKVLVIPEETGVVL